MEGSGEHQRAKDHIGTRPFHNGIARVTLVTLAVRRVVKRLQDAELSELSQ
jgi:hypothetical protein